MRDRPEAKGTCDDVEAIRKEYRVSEAAALYVLDAPLGGLFGPVRSPRADELATLRLLLEDAE